MVLVQNLPVKKIMLSKDSVDFLNDNLSCDTFTKLIVKSKLHSHKLLVKEKYIQTQIVSWIMN